MYRFSVTQLCLTLVILWTTASQASLSFTISQSLLKLMFIYLSVHLPIYLPPVEYYSALNNIMYIIYIYNIIWGFPVAQMVKNLHAMWETWVQSLGLEDPLEKRKATHSSILAWRIPWKGWWAEMLFQDLWSNYVLKYCDFHYDEITPGTKMMVVCYTFIAKKKKSRF